MLDISEIKKILPHRYPFLLVDRVVELDDKKVVAIKNVTANEEFFNGHFPDYPVMPGVLIVEALAQTSGIAMMQVEGNKGKIGLFAGIDGCRFKRQVVPGDQLRLEAEILRLRGSIAKAKVKATVDEELVCEAEIMFALTDVVK
ncbi:3-hydroxyacyl-ACP dehydratase FabZ [Listeria grandensis]|uniref:3-hydroxyacyl-[acyl-carrier-protein] dehydratase FabZ n=2 Tax=Listeria grandensis TaxID=1494963 RepID=W7BV00_9LIST|nr:3-hydroxyacyl-ACP dehydratase FabZ [Listeria grandensis]EUJ24163.1 (3R)-hydroxymyristoyl-ACP dehydratase [Listeria grandensis FSL F6-0971]MBC1474660.1 3-hydroxyacyl-ACP dehydratase FabZ [Listeria grandensis]MBC1935787.1 3-hydroxyacyl-ACP dehydratase FabZ [Listeria grandensis]MBC6315838.1 3-hydroxyacyl-ACP dehydratase FabZ [Listeria grandensis]